MEDFSIVIIGIAYFDFFIPVKTSILVIARAENY